MNHKSAFINIIGNPNVGKSSLVNSFMGYKLSIITAKAQTTRHRIFCILNSKNFQFVFSDTPGLIEPKNKLHESMMNFVKSSYDDADIIIYVVDASSEEIINKNFKLKLKSLSIPVIIVINKIDLINNEKLDLLIEEIKNDFTDSLIFPISVKENFNIKTVLENLKNLSPISPPYFPKDQITDKPERFFVNEIIREKILKFYKKEIPYSVEVEVEEFKDEEKIIRIRTIINVSRDSQKGIIIGHQGKSLKKIGTLARRDLEQFFQKKIFLNLYVKVNKDWRNDDKQLKRFGYS